MKLPTAATSILRQQATRTSSVQMRFKSHKVNPDELFPHTLSADFGKKHIARGLNRLTDAVITSGKGSYVEFSDGRKMLDFTCGIAVTNLGK